MANRERKKLFTGARASIIARDVKVGWATGCSGSRIYQKQGVEVLDNIEMEEYATLGYMVRLRMTVVGLVDQSLVSAGLLPEIGQSNETHLAAAIALEPFTVQVMDRITGKPRWEFERCEIEEESFNLAARTLMMTDVSLVGIRVADVHEL